MVRPRKISDIEYQLLELFEKKRCADRVWKQAFIAGDKAAVYGAILLSNAADQNLLDFIFKHGQKK